MLQGTEPLHSALDVEIVSRRTIKAIVGGVLACEIPCGGARYVGSGLSKYEGMRCTSRWERNTRDLYDLLGRCHYRA